MYGWSNAVYDASGSRVAQQIDGGWTYLIYDAFGKMIAEYGGQPVYDEGGIKYVYQDWQGSTRAVLGAGGAVLARNDYTTFGEEIGANVGMRTTAQGFTSNNTLNQKYALTERDKATGLDHTWFRKMENQGGRWTSPDPYNGSMSISDPQSFNRYSYVTNQPTNFVDPSGLFAVYTYCEPDRWDEKSATLYAGRCYTIIISDGGEPSPLYPPLPPPITIKEFKENYYKNFGTILNDCLKTVFGDKIAKKLGVQNIKNSPNIDVSLTGTQLGGKAGKPIPKAKGLPAPDMGKNGTVFIGSEYFSDPIFLEDNYSTFTHELGNILSIRATKTAKSGGSYEKFGDPNGIGEAKDTDTGAKLELCVHKSVNF